MTHNTFWNIYLNFENIDEETKKLFEHNLTTDMFTKFFNNKDIGLRLSVSLAIYIYLFNNITCNQ